MAHFVNPALRMLRALDDPLRYAILTHLMAGSATVSELGLITGAAQAKLSNHLAILRARGLVTGERRGRQVVYALAGFEIASVVEALERAAGLGALAARTVPKSRSREAVTITLPGGSRSLCFAP